MIAKGVLQDDCACGDCEYERVNEAIDHELDRIQEIDAQVGHLQRERSDALDRAVVTVGQGFRAGTLDEGDLLDIYAKFKTDARVGFGPAWRDHVPVPTATLAVRYRERIRNAPNGPYGKFWVGAYPFVPGNPLPSARVPVVYVLFFEGRPIYLGSTGKLRQRLAAHERTGKRFDKWIAYPCDSRQAAYALEDGMLAEFKPPLNISDSAYPIPSGTVSRRKKVATPRDWIGWQRGS